MIDIIAIYYYISKVVFKIGIANCQYVGNLFMFLGACLVSISIEAALSMFTFLLFLFAHILWGATAVVLNETRLLQLNIFLIGFDVIAIVNRI